MSWEELSKLTKEEIIECAKELKNGWQQEVWDKNEILNDRFELQRKINTAIEYIKKEEHSNWVMYGRTELLEILGDKE